MESPYAGTRPRIRARRSQYRARRAPVPSRRLLALVLLVVVVGGGLLAGFRVISFLHVFANLGNPVTAVAKQVEPPAGSVAYKLKHGQRVNLLLLGYGGAENDAPYLTDSMLVVSIDPASHRVMQVSMPRDLMVGIDAFPSGPLSQKINVAYAIGVDDADWPGKKPAYSSSRLAGGRLAEDTVSRVTGLEFDGFVAMDYRAFRDIVNAVGGVDVVMDTPLDDCHYPDYRDGYVNHGVPVGYRCPPGAGIHFPAGPQHLDGEQALELARSREASEPEQASDYGRARRQQMILGAIRKKAATANGLAHAPQLMDALQKDFVSSLDLSDLEALYAFGGKLPDSAIGHFGITEGDLVDRFYARKGSCAEFYADVLCPVDPSFAAMKAFFAALFVDPRVLAERAPVEVVNASSTLDDMGERVTAVLRPLGFQVTDPVRRKAADHSTVYDYSGGRYALSAQWMASYFGATVVTVTDAGAAPSPPPGASTSLVVVLGRDYALRWIGKG